jgi:hypothetical protein
MSQILISIDAQHGAHRSNPRPAYIPNINIALAETAVARFGGRVGVTEAERPVHTAWACLLIPDTQRAASLLRVHAGLILI